MSLSLAHLNLRQAVLTELMSIELNDKSFSVFELAMGSSDGADVD